MQPVAHGSLKVSEVATNDRAMKEIGEAIVTADELRDRLARLYAGSSGGSPVENELGDCLTELRRTLKRLRKARQELALTTQMEMDLN
ncbi:MAG TPA: hypothetical protein VF916_09955 [Ktedonobacterales bacterium]